jgi:NAD(P)-dependent dehydrogenase (short-subunit alcohol dehydrogenase family)
MTAAQSTDIADMQGRVVLVTGATSGLGYATAEALGRRGATVLVHGRTRQTADQAVDRLSASESAAAGKYVALHAELSSLDEVRGLVPQVRNISPGGVGILINNAGAQFHNRELSPEGVEMTTAVVHLAPAALCRLLMDDLQKAADRSHTPALVVTVSSTNERFGKPVDDWSYATGYRQARAYSNAKLMALSYTYALARHLDGQGVAFRATDPGVVFTDFGRKAGGGFAGAADRVLRPVAPLLIASPDKGAARSVVIAVDPALGSDTGGFYAKGTARTSSKQSRDQQTIERVRALTEARLASFGV